MSVVMAELTAVRPVFHSEADLQHAFSRVLWKLAPEVECRLEVQQMASGDVEHLDLLCIGLSERTAVKFKYVNYPGLEPRACGSRVTGCGVGRGSAVVWVL